MTTKNLATIYSAELEGIDAKLIEVEVDINVGIHAFNIVGLADKALNEAKERVNSALKNSGVKPPNRENRKITINLAPADIRKTGSQYDLAIALGYLFATKQIAPFDVSDKIFLGELALDGRLRPVNGVLNVTQMAADRSFTTIFVPLENAREAMAIKTITVIPIRNLQEMIDLIEGKLSPRKILDEAIAISEDSEKGIAIKNSAPDFAEIKGQKNAKRALTIAAAGRHNILMIGPPGVGKSFLALAFAGILPETNTEEAIEVTKIWSVAGLRPAELMRERPFRAPHQTISTTALLGGGQDPHPGEISLAHCGVLFLDEMPEFQRPALEGLREPLESGRVQVSRAKKNYVFPAKFMLVAAMNPCPCGFYGDAENECKCAAYEVIKYQKKISGPLLDRIDLQIKVGRVKTEELRRHIQDSPANQDLENPAIKEIIQQARNRQADRFSKHGKEGMMTNSDMDVRAIRISCFAR